MAHSVTDDSFQQEVLESNIPVLVDFWAEWCGPCRMLGPIIDEVAKSLEGRVKILKMNIDENPNIPSTFGVRSIPTMMIFKGGQLVSTKIGVLPQNSIEEWVDSSI